MIIRNHNPAQLILTEAQKRSIRKADPDQEIKIVSGNTDALKSPGLITKFAHAAQAGGRVAKAAISRNPIKVSQKEKSRRLSICQSCDLWNDEGNMGLGECKHNDCGCTRFKHSLATEKCPIGKWA